MIQLRDKKDNNKQFLVKPRPKKANLGKLKPRELEENFEMSSLPSTPQQKIQMLLLQLAKLSKLQPHNTKNSF